MHRSFAWRPGAAISLALVVNALFTAPASAHVKWFCAFNVAGDPRGLENVLCADFELLTGLSLLCLMGGSLIEGTTLGLAMTRAMDRATTWVRENTELMFRAGVGFFFVSIWAAGGILLTPELKTSSNLIGAIHLGIAASMLSRRTMPLGAIGIAVIFATAIWNYGTFHLSDYPIFLGVAAFIALKGTDSDFFGVRAIDVVRWAAGITLMWASVEKWAYPEWSFPLLAQHPAMTLGFDAEFFMKAAGAIEFALAFGLLWSPLVRRVSAVLLAGMFVSAIIQFGKIDMIGHMLIIVVLFAVVADDGGDKKLVRMPWALPAAYAASLALFLAGYYGLHALMYGASGA